MNRYKLRDLSLNKLEYGSGAAACDYDGNTRYVRITDIDNDGNLGSDIVSPNIVDEKYLLMDGDILFARTGATVGKTYLYQSKAGRCIYAGFLIRVVPNQELIRPSYLYYFTKSPQYKGFVQQSMKVVAQPNINAKQYGDLEINVPSLEIQDKIIKKLQIVSEIIALRKKELQKMDDLIKARFVEMFGDCVLNTKKWKTKRLGDIAEVGSSKRVFVEDLKKSGIPFYRGTEIGALAEGKVVEAELFISEEHYANLCKATGAPKMGDLLMPSICADGRIWVVDTTEPFYFKDGRVLWVHAIDASYDSTFLLYTLKDRIMTNYSSIASGTTFAELKIFALKECRIFDVPLELQKQFADFVTQVNKSKIVCLEILQKTAKFSYVNPFL